MVGKSHIDDREIDDGHEVRHDQQGEGPPATTQAVAMLFLPQPADVLSCLVREMCPPVLDGV